MDNKKNIRQIIFISTAALVLALLYFFVYPIYGSYFPKCLLYTFTGFYCPGCGTQRSVTALLHGDVHGALHNNVLAMVALPFLVYSSVIFCINTFNKKQIQQKIFYSPLFVKAVLIAVITFSILRNIPSYPFDMLAPL